MPLFNTNQSKCNSWIVGSLSQIRPFPILIFVKKKAKQNITMLQRSNEWLNERLYYYGDILVKTGVSPETESLSFLIKMAVSKIVQKRACVGKCVGLRHKTTKTHWASSNLNFR